MSKVSDKQYGEPKIYSTPGQSQTSEKVLVIPGYGETISHNKGLVDALSSKGFDAMTFSQPRRSGGLRDEDSIQRQGNVVLSILDGSMTEGEKIHAVAHSMGSAAVLKAVLKHPERFLSVTLMQPVGLTGLMNLRSLATRASKKVLKNQVGALKGQGKPDPKAKGYSASTDVESAGRFTRRVSGAQLSSLGVLGANPNLSFREATEAGEYSIGEDLQRVMELGIPVHIVLSRGDELFTYDDLDLDSVTSSSSVSSVADYDASHDTFWMQPARTAEIVSQLIHKS